MNTTKNTTLSPHQKKVQKFREWIKDEIKKNNRNKRKKHISDKPYMGFTADINSKRIVLSYMLPKRDATCKRNGGIRMMKKQKYLGNWDLKNYKKDRFSVLQWYSFICDEVELAQRDCFVDEGSLEYWIEQYCSPLPRRGIKTIPKEKTRANEGKFLKGYLDWIRINHPTYLQIWAHNDDKVREICKEYLRYRTTTIIPKSNGAKGNLWGESTTFNCYRIIRAFLNWLAIKLPSFKPNRLANLDVEKPKPNLETFTNMEFKKIVEFMDDYKDDAVWFWFIPMLRVMLTSGCRISEVTNMRINDLNFIDNDGTKVIEWGFVGKGNKKRVVYIDDADAYNDVWKSITDKKNKIRTDKEYVFHKHYHKNGNNQYSSSSGGGIVEDIDLPFTSSGIQHKFKKMVKFLKINPKLTPHSTRRFFITEKLLETGGDIPLTALLVGHSSFSQVNHYQSHNQQSEMLIGRKNSLSFKDVIKRKKGIKE